MMMVMSASSVSRDCFFDMRWPPFGSRGDEKYDDDPPIGRPGMENCTSRMMIPDVKSIVIARHIPKFGGRHLRALLESGVEGGFRVEPNLFAYGQDGIVFVGRIAELLFGLFDTVSVYEVRKVLPDPLVNELGKMRRGNRDSFGQFLQCEIAIRPGFLGLHHLEQSLQIFFGALRRQ